MDVKILKLIVLFERLPEKHPAREKVYGELKRALAGDAGEKRTMALLKRELDLGSKFSIFRDLSLPYKEGFAQVDFLVLNAKLVSVLEVKNMVGDFHFDSINFQFHRILEGKREGMRNPETQLHRAVKASEEYFDCKVHGTIVLSSRSGKVVVAPKLYPIIALDYLPFHLEKLVDPKLSLNFDELEGLLRLRRGHYDGPELLGKHKLTRDSLEVGVRCLECGRLSCEWKGRKWRCGKCGTVSSDAHEFALQEYAMLFGNEISSREAHRWLGVDDKYILFRMLEKFSLKSRSRGRRFIIENKAVLMKHFGKIYS